MKQVLAQVEADEEEYVQMNKYLSVHCAKFLLQLKQHYHLMNAFYSLLEKYEHAYKLN